MTAIYLGLISGTSMDAIEAVLVDLAGGIELIEHHTTPWSTSVQGARDRLAHDPGSVSLPEASALDQMFGVEFADAALATVQAAGLEPSMVRCIGSHGQTVLHAPDEALPYSVQLGSAARIAARTGRPVANDFRAMDLAAGGQGAPLAPFFHEAWLRHPDEDRVVLNLGGIANLTWLPAATASPIAGFDTGPANCLMDVWTRRHLGEPCDRDGAWAASEEPDASLLASLLDDPYFSRRGPRSTGRDYFSAAWLESRLAAFTGLSPARVQRTLLELTVASIAKSVAELPGRPARVIACGGGANSGFLLARLREVSEMPVAPADDYGLPAAAVEGAAFAWLAKCRLENRALDLPAVTGARERLVLGALTAPWS